MPFRPELLAFPEGTSQEEMRQTIKGMANEAEGLCPNGCGPIVYLDPHNRECPVCHFRGWSNVARKGVSP
jgi:hypothetical protein